MARIDPAFLAGKRASTCRRRVAAPRNMITRMPIRLASTAFAVFFFDQPLPWAGCSSRRWAVLNRTARRRSVCGSRGLCRGSRGCPRPPSSCTPCSMCRTTVRSSSKIGPDDDPPLPASSSSTRNLGRGSGRGVCSRRLTGRSRRRGGAARLEPTRAPARATLWTTETPARAARGSGPGALYRACPAFAFGLVSLAFWAWFVSPQLAGPMVVFGSLIGPDPVVPHGGAAASTSR